MPIINDGNSIPQAVQQQGPPAGGFYCTPENHQGTPVSALTNSTEVNADRERIAANNNTTIILEAVNDEVMDVRGGTEDTLVMVRGHDET